MSTRIISTKLAVAVTICLALSASASAQSHLNSGQRLTDLTAIFDYTFGGTGNLPIGPPTGSGTVSMNFQLDGAPNPPGPPSTPSERQLVRGNWFYRVAGDTRERYLTNASTKSTTGNSVEWKFSDIYGPGPGPGPTLITGVSAEMGFGLISHNPDSATLTTGLCFTNNGPTFLQVESFFVVDFNLGGTAADDMFLPLNTSSGGRLIQAEDTISGGVVTTGVMFGPTATGSAMGNDNILFSQLNDNNLDSFPDVNPTPGPSPGGSFGGDGAALLQFSEVIPPFSTSICTPVFLAVARNGQTPIIPEPSSGILAIFAAMSTVATMRRRQE